MLLYVLNCSVMVITLSAQCNRPQVSKVYPCRTFKDFSDRLCTLQCVSRNTDCLNFPLYTQPLWDSWGICHYCHPQICTLWEILMQRLGLRSVFQVLRWASRSWQGSPEKPRAGEWVPLNRRDLCWMGKKPQRSCTQRTGIFSSPWGELPHTLHCLRGGQPTSSCNIHSA